MRGLVHAIAFGDQPSLLARLGSRASSGTASVALAHAPWWNDSNVVGLCFAPKVRRGRVEDLSLQVLVRAKRAVHRVPSRHRVPSSIELNPLGSRGRVATDVREVGASRLEVLVSSERPVRPGFNIGHRNGGSGTLTCAVRSLDTGERLGLSCSHVIARYGRALPGERVLVPSIDQARLLDVLFDAPFGTLERVASLGFGFERGPFNVDAATVRPDDPSALDNQLALLDLRPSAIRDDVPVGLPVRKVGSATQETLGTVNALHAVVSLPFVDATGRERDVWFTDMVGVSQFSAPGDSGALVLDSAGAAVGLLMGSFLGMSVCMPIRRVLESLRCELDVGPREAPPPVA